MGAHKPLNVEQRIRLLFLFMLTAVAASVFSAWESASKLERIDASGYLMVLGFALALITALRIVWVLWIESQRRAREADKRQLEVVTQQRQTQQNEVQAKQTNDQNHAAILKLMSELQEIANGDLTIQATISEGMTGVIADSVNYAIEELRKLVGRVALCTEQLAKASTQAEAMSVAWVSASLQQPAQSTSHGDNAPQTDNSVMTDTEGSLQLAEVGAQPQVSAQQLAQNLRELSACVRELQSAVARIRVTA